jgi:hypothetical protein
MPARSKKPRTLDDVLSRLGAKLDAWQVRALFLGAQTSTSVRLGPHHLLDRIFGDDRVLGDDLADANANLQVLMALWNQLVTDHQADRVKLSAVATGEPPTRAELQALVSRRNDEITWFLRGIDAGGDDPVEFGPEGEALFRKLAEACAFFDAYLDLLGRTPDKDLPKAREPIDQSTTGLGRPWRAPIARRARPRVQTATRGKPRRSISRRSSSRVQVGRRQPKSCGDRYSSAERLLRKVSLTLGEPLPVRRSKSPSTPVVT